MDPAEGKLNVAGRGKLRVAGIAVDLQDPLEALEMHERPLSRRPALGRRRSAGASSTSMPPIASLSIPLRTSTSLVATITRTVPPGPITSWPSAP